MNDRKLKLEVILAAIDRATGPLKAVMSGSTKLSRELRAAKDRLKELDATQKHLDGFRSTARAVSVAANELKGKQARLKELKAAMAETLTPSRALVKEFERIRNETHQVATRHTKLIEKQQRLRDSLREAGIDTRKLGDGQRDLKSRIEAANGAVQRQTDALKRQGEQMRRLQSARAQYDKTLDTRNKLAGAGAGMAAAGGGALYAGARFASTGIDFGAAMSRVQALAQLEKTSEAFIALRKQARELGAATSFTATQAAEAQGFLAMAGFKSAQIMAAMPGMLDLAKAGGTDLQRTADIASNILSSFGLEADKMGRVGDVLTKAFTSSNVSLENLAETMKYVGPVAMTAGMSLEQSAGMAGLLGNIGLQGSMAGTSLRAMLLRLAAPPKAAREAMEALKVSAKDAHGNVRQIPDVLYDIARATQKMGTGDRLGYIKDIFGEEASAGMADLVSRGGLGELQKYIDIIKAAQGTAGSTAQIMADNAGGDILSLQSAWEDFQITIFDTNEGPLRGLIKSITGIVRGISLWATANPAITATLVKLAAVAAIVVAGVGALLLAVAAVLGPLAMLKFTLSVLAIKAGLISLPILAIVAAVAALAAAAYLIYQHWGPIKAWFAGLWDGIKQNFNATVEWFGALPARFALFGTQMMQGLVNGITGAMGAAKAAITGVGDNVVGWFKDKLGIHSPSRVFAELGGFTMQGLAQGLDRGAGQSVAAILRTTRQLTAAGVLGLAGAGTAIAAPDAMGIRIDNRPPLAATGTAGATVTNVTYNINVTAGAGTDEAALRKMFRAELERHKHEIEARSRSSLSDRD